MGDFGTEGSIVHQKDFQIFSVVNNEFFQAIR